VEDFVVKQIGLIFAYCLIVVFPVVAQDITLESQTITNTQNFEAQGKVEAKSVNVSGTGQLGLKASRSIHLSATVGNPLHVVSGANLTASIVPSVKVLQPLDGRNVSSRPQISVQAMAITRGINRASLTLAFDGNAPVAPSAVSWDPVNSENGSGTFTYSPDTDFLPGIHSIAITLSDKLGNTATVTSAFNVTTTNANGFPAWAITDLGGHFPTSINIHTEVVGNTAGQDAFYWDGSFIALEVPDKYTNADNILARSNSISDSGIIVGAYNNVSQQRSWNPAVWTPADYLAGSVAPSITLPSDNEPVYATGINASGTQICGYGNSGAYLWSSLPNGPYTMLEINLAYEPFGSVALGSNRQGDIAGRSYSHDAPCIWGIDGSVTYLPTNAFPGASGVVGYAGAINDFRDTVGTVALLRDGETSANGRAGLLWQNNVPRSLGENVLPSSLNNSRHIVGTFIGADSARAFFWKEQLIDMNNFLPDNSGWTLEQATCINDLDQIVGTGWLNNVHSGFLLTPPPGIVFPPTAPSGLTAVVSAEPAVTLNWTDNANGVAKFVILRSELPNGPYSEIATALEGNTSFIDKNVSISHNYSYCVKSFSSDGDSPGSNTVTVGWPNTPTNLAAYANSPVQILLQWLHSRLHTENYVIERSEDTNQNYIIIGHVPNDLTLPLVFIDNNVSSNKQYFYRVSAFVTEYQSPPSNEATIPMDLLSDVKIETDTPYISESGGIGIFKITRTRNLDKALTVKLKPIIQSLQGAYNYTTDPLPLNEIVIPIGSSSGIISVNAVDNHMASNNALELDLDLDSNYILSNPRSATLTIVGSQNQTPVFSVNVLAGGISINGINYNAFRVESQWPLSVDALVDVDISGDAQLGIDYDLQMADGSPFATDSLAVLANIGYADIAVVPNATLRHMEDLTATFSILPATDSINDAYFVGNPNSQTIYLNANAPIVGVDAIAASIVEGQGAQNAFRVSISNGTIAVDDVGSILSFKMKDKFGALHALSNPSATISPEAGTSNYIVAFTPADDQIYTGDQVIVVSIIPASSILPYRIAKQSAQITLIDTAPMVSIVVLPPATASIGLPGIVKFVKTGGVDHVDFVATSSIGFQLGVDYDVQDLLGHSISGTATFGSDNSAFIQIAALKSPTLNQPVTLTIVQPVNGGIAKPSKGVVTILSDANVLPRTGSICDNPLSGQVSGFDIVAGKTGDMEGTFSIDGQGQLVSFTNNHLVTVNVDA
jgi:hypothetical protein